MSSNYSINFNTLKRSKKLIKFIIIHYTGMKSQAKAIERLCDSSSKVSAHYFIKDNGKLLNLVPDLYEAWHAGKSSWKNLKALNKYSIGIEINNSGHDYGYPKFKKRQISTLKKLLKNLINKYKIRNRNIWGHSDIAPDRKKDPGEKFPWKNLANKDLSIWHKLKENKIKILRNQKLNSKDQNMFFKNLYKFGYSKMNKNKLFLIKAFQRRFRQSLINGKVDKECFIISKSLTKS